MNPVFDPDSIPPLAAWQRSVQDGAPIPAPVEELQTLMQNSGDTGELTALSAREVLALLNEMKSMQRDLAFYAGTVAGVRARIERANLLHTTFPDEAVGTIIAERDAARAAHELASRTLAHVRGTIRDAGGLGEPGGEDNDLRAIVAERDAARRQRDDARAELAALQRTARMTAEAMRTDAAKVCHEEAEYLHGSDEEQAMAWALHKAGDRIAALPLPEVPGVVPDGVTGSSNSPAVPAYLVVRFREDIPPEVFPFGDPVQAAPFHDRIGAQWSDTFLCLVVRGGGPPRDRRELQVNLQAILDAPTWLPPTSPVPTAVQR